jgi:hypothetical protein
MAHGVSDNPRTRGARNVSADPPRWPSPAPPPTARSRTPIPQENVNARRSGFPPIPRLFSGTKFVFETKKSICDNDLANFGLIFDLIHFDSISLLFHYPALRGVA